MGEGRLLGTLGSGGWFRVGRDVLSTCARATALRMLRRDNPYIYEFETPAGARRWKCQILGRGATERGSCYKQVEDRRVLYFPAPRSPAWSGGVARSVPLCLTARVCPRETRLPRSVTTRRPPPAVLAPPLRGASSSRSLTETPVSSAAEPEVADVRAKRGEDRLPSSRLRALALRLEARRSSIFADRS